MITAFIVTYEQISVIVVCGVITIGEASKHAGLALATSTGGKNDGQCFVQLNSVGASRKQPDERVCKVEDHAAHGLGRKGLEHLLQDVTAF